MVKLNLPEYDFRITKSGGKLFIFDPLRKKNIVLTPEEWVRQHFIQYLINDLHYAKPLIKIESGLRYNNLPRRSDILVYDRKGQPFLIVECKSFEFKIDQKAFDQISRYNQTLKAPYIVVTNGMQHFCCQISHKDQSFEFLDNIPIAGQ
ncbi:type I restriction enzyme HsdR N-terminal domain-containing protein [Fulvivirgaceae bacterium BMA10]|uniref:Type I restriction enzyme HsdR N-terminal domain-containing protein n=1 Tax=Splendidivirga corallicola TaxID=3051826 RepID=A0ABT8KRW0_9BACT|nr:type I restriction enzyme HsdR N-terminal domain-containing protein [Fulvivirgaceae bacterium BMA10]